MHLRTVKNILNAIIKRVLSKETLINDVNNNEEKDKIPTVFININYPGQKGKHLLKSVLRNCDAPLIKKLTLSVVILSRKYCFSQISKISSTS